METFRRPDKKAPRVRFDRYCALNSGVYARYTKENPDTKLDTLVKFKKFIVDCNEALVELALNDRLGVDLPYGEGRVLLKSYTPRHIKVTDLSKSLLTGFRIYTKNYETDERICRITYTVYNKKFTSYAKKAWGFEPTRQFKLKASKCFVDNPNMYIHKNDKYDKRRNYKSNQGGTQTDTLRH
jgi:hypothetical protein